MKTSDLKLLEVQERESMALGVKVGIITVVVGGILLFVSVFILATVNSVIPRTDFTSEMNATFDSITSNVFNALNILGISLIIIGVGVIVAATIGMFGE